MTTAAAVTDELIALARGLHEDADPAVLALMRERAWSLHQRAFLDVVREVEYAVLACDEGTLAAWVRAGLVDSLDQVCDLRDDDTAVDALACEVFAATPAGMAVRRIGALSW